MKLYLIVKTALGAGLRCAQAIHAFRAFVGEYPHIETFWHLEHNNIVVLRHEDPESLAALLRMHGLRLSLFREPDLDNEVTALCVEPAGARYLSTLPLA